MNGVTKPEVKEVIRNLLAVSEKYMMEMDSIRESLKEAINEASEKTGIDKRTLRRMIRYIHSSVKNRTSLEDEIGREKFQLEEIEDLVSRK